MVLGSMGLSGDVARAQHERAGKHGMRANLTGSTADEDSRNGAIEPPSGGPNRGAV